MICLIPVDNEAIPRSTGENMCIPRQRPDTLCREEVSAFLIFPVVSKQTTIALLYFKWLSISINVLIQRHSTLPGGDWRRFALSLTAPRRRCIP